MKLVVAILFPCALAALPKAKASTIDLEKLFDSECTNCDDIAAKVGFTDANADPFEDTPWNEGYETFFNDNVDCTVFVDKKKTEEEGHLVYSLIESGDPASESSGCGKYATHAGACGVCSDLKSLASYLKYPNLVVKASECAALGFAQVLFANDFPIDQTNPFAFFSGVAALNGLVRAGRTINIPQTAVPAIEACMSEEIELEGLCLSAWANNGLQTGLKCGLDCFFSQALAPNVDSSATEEFILSQPPLGPIVQFLEYEAMNYCDPDICPNEVNGAPACYPEAFEEDSEFRLNSCLQCDECHMSGRFSEVAGRNRRNSGLESGIARPEYLLVEFDHDYTVPEKLCECQYDCDRDSECHGRLLCADEHKRQLRACGEDERKADCGPVGDRVEEVCFDPTLLEDCDAVDGPLDDCEVDCDSDSDCKFGLLCADEHKDQLRACGEDERKAYCGAVGDGVEEVCFDPTDSRLDSSCDFSDP